VTVKIVAVGSSGVSGAATLTEVPGGQTQVVVTVAANQNPDMPSMVAIGPCSRIDENHYWSLSDTRNGTGTSLIPVTLAVLLASPHQVHLHTSGDDLSYAACGDIK
jgi:hypothetical protein